MTIPFRPNNSATPAVRYLENWTPAENLPPWLQLGGQIRGRVEGPSGTSLVNNSSDADDASRIRVDFGIKPVSWLRFFAEAQDARTEGYNSPIAPSTLYDPLDLRQAYIDLRTKGPVTLELRAGRQELAFGGERLIGPADRACLARSMRWDHRGPRQREGGFSGRLCRTDLSHTL